jgi:hypothetical protein
MHDAALPSRLGKELGGALGQPHAGVGDDQLDAMETAALEVLEERAPACLVLFGPFADAESPSGYHRDNCPDGRSPAQLTRKRNGRTLTEAAKSYISHMTISRL